MNTPLQSAAANTGDSPTFRFRVYTQLAVISALTLHAVRVKSKKGKLGFFWDLFDPLSQVAIWFVLFTVLRGPKSVYDMNMFLFLGTGVVGLFLFQNIAQDLPRFVGRQKSFLRSPLVQQVDLLLAGFLVEATVMTLVACLVWGGIILFGLGFAPADPLGVILSSATLALLGLGFGALNTMLLVIVPIYDKFLSVLFRVLFFTSGVIIPFDAMPVAVQHYVIWNPALQGVEQLRSAWSYTFESGTTSNGYVLFWAAAFFFLALVLDHHGLRTRLKS